MIVYRTVLHHGTGAVVAFKNLRIDLQRLLKLGGGFRILAGIVISEPQIGMRSRLVRIDLHRPFIFADGATEIFLMVVHHAQVVHGAGVRLVGLGRAGKVPLAWSKFPRLR